jgi:hypothetical protein
VPRPPGHSHSTWVALGPRSPGAHHFLQPFAASGAAALLQLLSSPEATPRARGARAAVAGGGAAPSPAFAAAPTPPPSTGFLLDQQGQRLTLRMQAALAAAMAEEACGPPRCPAATATTAHSHRMQCITALPVDEAACGVGGLWAPQQLQQQQLTVLCPAGEATSSSCGVEATAAVIIVSPTPRAPGAASEQGAPCKRRALARTCSPSHARTGRSPPLSRRGTATGTSARRQGAEVPRQKHGQLWSPQSPRRMQQGQREAEAGTLQGELRQRRQGGAGAPLVVLGAALLLLALVVSMALAAAARAAQAQAGGLQLQLLQQQQQRAAAGRSAPHGHLEEQKQAERLWRRSWVPAALDMAVAVLQLLALLACWLRADALATAVLVTADAATLRRTTWYS